MSDNFLKRFLKENPHRLQTYVQWGVAAAHLVVAPVNKLLRHLLVVQDLDPNTAPGVKIREALQEALNAAVDVKHRKDYDDSFDFSRIGQGFNRLDNKLEITEDDFKKMTDLNYATDPPKPPIPEEPLFVSIVQPIPDPVDELKQLLDDSEEESKKSDLREEAFLAGSLGGEKALEEALEKLVRVAKSLKASDSLGVQFDPEELGPEDVEKLLAHAESLKSFKESHKDPTFKSHNPRIRRAKTGNTKAVRSSSKGLNRSPKSQVSTLKKNLTRAYKKHMLKLSEAQALAQEMVARGLCVTVNDKEDIKLQVDEIMKFDRSAFEALGRVVSRPPLIAVATSKVDKEVETIQKFIAEGKIQPTEVDDLVGEGMDPEVAAAWKHKYGQKLPSLLVEQTKKIAKENKASGHFRGSFRRSPRR